MTPEQDEHSAPPPPATLGQDGRRLWSDVTARWTLRPDEERVLAAACAELDLLARIEAELPDAPLTVRGAGGGTIANPLVTEARHHRKALSELLKSLRLPDDDEDGAQTLSGAAVSAAARRAARARWDQHAAARRGA